MEQWRQIEGCSDYLVSDEGNVQRVSTGKILKASPNKHGFLRVHLRSDDGRPILKEVHIMVARAFIAGWQPGFVVKHLNGSIIDNRVDNLEWRERGLRSWIVEDGDIRLM